MFILIFIKIYLRRLIYFGLGVLVLLLLVVVYSRGGLGVRTGGGFVSWRVGVILDSFLF